MSKKPANHAGSREDSEQEKLKYTLFYTRTLPRVERYIGEEKGRESKGGGEALAVERSSSREDQGSPSS